MLARNGLQWTDVDLWMGDRLHGGDYFAAEKSNKDLLRALATDIGITMTELQQRGLRIFVPQKAKGSVRRDIQALNTLAVAKRLRVHKRCVHFMDGARSWEGDPQDPAKDPIDAARYAIFGLDARRAQMGLQPLARIE